jgi:hypothetical protein
MRWWPWLILRLYVLSPPSPAAVNLIESHALLAESIVELQSDKRAAMKKHVGLAAANVDEPKAAVGPDFANGSSFHFHFRCC